MYKFQGKNAIVTGGGAGIGRELCMELAKAGAKVYVFDINKEFADTTVSMISESGFQAEAVILDMRSPSDVDAAVKMVAAKGTLDYMFNNAGVIMFGEFRDMSLEDWDRFIDCDIKSVIYGTKSAYEVMMKQGSGHIINTSSVFGLFPFAVSTGYSAVKHAIVGLTLALRSEAAGFNIKVSCSCPGSVLTEVKKTYKVFHADREKFNSFIPKQLTPHQAAVYTLKGVWKNKGIIAFPFYDKVPWYLYRMFPSLNAWLQTKLVEIFREKIRYKDE
jgi:NAD(P)-dependent dehydrogenase (short-subunit alcohol dehydrogenase family)